MPKTKPSSFVWPLVGFVVALGTLQIGETVVGRSGVSTGTIGSVSQEGERYQRHVVTKDKSRVTFIRGPHMRVATVEGDGKLIFVSGQVAFDENNEVVGVGDFEKQARQTFANVKTALAVVGATPDEVVQIKTYLTDRKNVPIFRTIREEFFAGRVPASTTVQVAGLNQEDFLIEVEVIAFR